MPQNPTSAAAPKGGPSPLTKFTVLERAGSWLLGSGIQQPTGGVARYYLADAQENRAISTEITGYALSTFTYLYLLTQDERYLDAARHAGQFLTRMAWDDAAKIFPFEYSDEDDNPPDALTYFFDCGIIVRGLLSLWRITQERELMDIAKACAWSMAQDFAAGDSEFHPILRLPSKEPLPRTEQWSRQPGCYQLKAALAWHDLYQETGDTDYLALYEGALAKSFQTQDSFLPGAEGERVMDRLHAYCYFLEGILPRVQRPEVARELASGIGKVAVQMRLIGPQFARSDVYAQLLRLRLLAERVGVVTVDRLAAVSEAEKLASYQFEHFDKRIHGGFFFARRGTQMQRHVNPVSTGFALQALVMWRQYLAGTLPFNIDNLI